MPHCPDCDDFGIRESIKDAPLDSVCYYCACRAGTVRAARAELAADDPRFDVYSVDAINASRAKLLKRLHITLPETIERKPPTFEEALHLLSRKLGS